MVCTLRIEAGDHRADPQRPLRLRRVFVTVPLHRRPRHPPLPAVSAEVHQLEPSGGPRGAPQADVQVIHPEVGRLHRGVLGLAEDFRPDEAEELPVGYDDTLPWHKWPQARPAQLKQRRIEGASAVALHTSVGSSRPIQ